MNRKSFSIIVFGCISIIIFLSIRGNIGVPTPQELLSEHWTVNGPFELSPERGRFALTYSLLENNSFQFSETLGRFAAPDVALSNGNFVSLFAPLLSFLIMPGYLIGKMLGASQVGTFAVVSVFAVFNVFLIRGICLRLGADNVSSTLAGCVFLFATPAFSYGVTLYQHHISTFLLLLSIYALLRFKPMVALSIILFAFASAIPLDYPNLFFLFPLAVYGAYAAFSPTMTSKSVSFAINPKIFLTVLLMIPPLLFFAWFNFNSYANPFQLSGTLESAVFDENFQLVNDQSTLAIEEETTTEEEGSRALSYFDTRNILNGFYIHFFSPDRGVIAYTPVILFGVVGLYIAYKKNLPLVPLFISIIGVNILLYSMWGDPWGGWAFGSRYLIPTYALLAIFIGVFLTRVAKQKIPLVVFSVFLFYSLSVNTLGALTTNALPPQIQVLQLEEITGVEQKYTYERNYDFLRSGNSKSFAYRTYFSEFVSPLGYYQFLTVSLWILTGSLLVMLFKSTSSKKGVIYEAKKK